MDFRKEGGYQYKKVGVIVWNIVHGSAIQTNLFDTIDRDKQSRLAAAIDAINGKNGDYTINVAVQSTTNKSWTSNANISASSTPPTSMMASL